MISKAMSQAVSSLDTFNFQAGVTDRFEVLSSIEDCLACLQEQIATIQKTVEVRKEQMVKEEIHRLLDLMV